MQKSEKDHKNVQSASLIDLKAELFRKQEEFKAQKLQNQSSGFVKGKTSTTKKKPSVFSKKNAGVSVRAEKDYEEKVEEENVFERSRKALENKAKLYEKISSGTTLPEEDGSGMFLVDFQKKVLDDVAEKREIERRTAEEKERKEIEEEQRQLLEPIPPPEDVDEEWVDYIDAFGRSRRCLRKDLPDLQKQDVTLQQRKKDNADGDRPSLLSNDMAQEIDRQKWENEEMARMEEEKAGPIHYTDVQHNEIRTHGVGYYKFNHEETVRQQQMEELNQLRQQTKDERSKIEKIKDKRKAALAARLAKVKQRKRERLGLPEPDEEEKSNSDEEIGPKVREQTKVEPEPLTRDDSWRSEVKSTRDWDKGKQYSMEKTEQAWLEKQRAERENEFAPPSFYYDSVPSTASSSGKAKKAKLSKDNSDHVESIIGKQLSDIRHSEPNPPDNAKHKPVTNTLAVNLNILPPSSLTPTDYSSNVSSSATFSSHNTDNQPSNANEHTSQSYSYPPNVSYAQPDMSVPPPNLVTQPNLTGPPPHIHPNHTIPPPNLNAPPPGYNAPPPNVNAPPPGYNAPPIVNAPPPSYYAPPPYVNVPPPNYHVPPPNFDAPPPNVNIAPNSSTYQSDTPLIKTETIKTEPAAESTQSCQNETVRKTFMAKEDIIDTRLMESCD